MRLLKMMLVVLFCAYVPSVWAQTSGVDELIIKSGIQRQVEQVPEVIKAQFEERFRQDQKMSAADRANLRNAAQESFDPTLMLKTVKAGISEGLTEQDISAILSWLNSPLGMKITKLEEEASSGEAYRAMVKFAQDMPEPQQNRLALIERMDNSAQLTEYTVQIKMDVALTMSEAIACATECNNFSREEVLKQLERVRPQIEQTSRQETAIHVLYSYQTLTDQELEEYIKFYETKVGQKYTKVFTTALSRAIKDASKTMGEKMGQALKAKKESAQ